MKLFYTAFATLILLVPFIAVAQPASVNTKLIRDLFDKMNKHDTTAIGSFFDDSAKIESPNWEGVQTGKQAVVTVYSRYFKGAPNMQFNITNITATDDAVVVEYTFGGQFTNPEPGTPEYMRNKSYTLKSCTHYNIAHNKIIAAISYFDQVSFLRQVGFFDPH